MAILRTKENGEIEITHEGMVVGTIERDCEVNVSPTLDYTDFRTIKVTYAVVKEGNEYKEVYGRSVLSPDVVVEVDATPEMVDDYRVWRSVEDDRLECERKEAEAKATAERKLAMLRAVKFGRILKVVRGRKVPKGTTGKCMWFGMTKFGPRVGIDTGEIGEDGKSVVVWTAASNCEAIPELSEACDAVVEKAQKDAQGKIDEMGDPKGKKFRHKDGAVGKCFWFRRYPTCARMGITVGTEKVWGFVNEFQKVEG